MNQNNAAKYTFLLMFAAATVASAIARADQGDLLERAVSAKIQTELSHRYAGARIELADGLHWTTAIPAGVVKSVRVDSENARGQVSFAVQSETGVGPAVATGWTSFAALVGTRVATRRIFPNEALNVEMFSTQELNVAAGPSHELRGVILPMKTRIEHLQARQTILEGQPLLSTAVEKTPDIRRGDSVRVNLISGGLTISASGTAEEPGFLEGRVRVLTGKAKRELVGKLLAGNIVEVRL